MNTKTRLYIIAEAGVNHNGDVNLAKQMIDVAADAGADAIKFQTFRADHVAISDAPKAEYQYRTTGHGESQLDMIRKLELNETEHGALIKHAKKRGLTFLSTPFDEPSLHLLTGKFDLQTIKIPSGEITNVPFLVAIARASQDVILSTGMCTLAEVETALGVLAFGFISSAFATPRNNEFLRCFVSAEGQESLRKRVTLLHCTTDYPASFKDVNLRAMDTLSAAFGLPIGYSDHTRGIHVSLAAVARGARIIEKHFTLDRELPGPDHKASLEPGELYELIRQAHEVVQGLGDGIKRPVMAEFKNIDVARRSLVASKAIKKGEIFTKDNLTCKRPGTGISAVQWYDFMGKTARRDFNCDELIDL